MDDREEGELSGSDADVDRMGAVSIIATPQQAVASLHQYRSPRATKHMPGLSSDDESSECSSDEDCHLSGPKRKKASKAVVSRLKEPVQFSPQQQELLQHGLLQHGLLSQPPPQPLPEPMKEDLLLQNLKKPRKRNNIWAHVLGEQDLSQEIGVIGLKKLEGDRNVENYDFRAAQALEKSHQAAVECAPEEEEEGELPDEGEMKDDRVEQQTKVAERLSRKRPLSQRVYRPPPPPVPAAGPGVPILLPAIDPTQHSSDEALALAIAEALQEPKPQIIQRVMEQLGRDSTMRLYIDTREKEQQGGLMVMTGDRRRTSGGVFLQLLKKTNLSKEQTAFIFPPDEAQLQWRRRRRAVHRRRNRERHDTDRPGSSCGSSDSSSRVAVVRSPRLPCEDSNDALELGGAKCPATSPAASPGPTPTTTPVVTPHGSDSEDENRNKEKIIDTALAIVQATSPALQSQEDEIFVDAPTAADEMDVY
ncbi:Phosphorylated adapter RNA export protein RNA-binding domain [Trinorchestia longiramus]|nr:Phosphorylated adapter RNA export protein RNA-binding domain [Trinorchestia longiramus]